MRQIILIVILLLSLCGILFIFLEISSLLLLVFVCIIIGICINLFLERQNYLNLHKILTITEYARDGNFDPRVIGIKGEAITVQISNNLNMWLDYLEAFLREIDTAVNCAAKGQFYRKGLAEALTGDFAYNIRSINNVLSSLENNHKESISNNLSKQLTNLSLKNQHDNVLKISNDMNKNIEQMQRVKKIIHSIIGNTQKSKNDIGTIINSFTSLMNYIQINSETTKDLSEESQNIAHVVSLIRGITDKTNLLALNAAIEAAKAGEHGKGFVVVAEEVRQLASHTQKATIEITTAIQAIQQGINNMQDNSYDIVSIAEESHKKILDFSNISQETQQQNEHLFSLFEVFSIYLILSVVKMEHILFKSNVYLGLNTHTKIEEYLEPISKLFVHKDISSELEHYISHEHRAEIIQKLQHHVDNVFKYMDKEINMETVYEIMKEVKEIEQESLKIFDLLNIKEQQ